MLKDYTQEKAICSNFTASIVSLTESFVQAAWASLYLIF